MAGKHDIPRLDADIKALRKELGALAADPDYEELLRIIHGNGWTTEPEFQLVHGVVKAMRVQVRELATLTTLVVTASRAIAKGQRRG